jgi:FMN phosphatase YigB (HAD superfamily)
MTRRCARSLLIVALAVAAACGESPSVAGAPDQPAADPLPSWRDGDTRRAIVDFVERVTTPNGADFVAPEDRVVVFDNDGTLWAERPSYTQAEFAIDHGGALAGTTTDEFDRLVADWIATARNPMTGRRYTAMVYQPMLELLAYLRGRGFAIYIVSGAGADFIRPWAQRVYGVPPDHVIGSRLRLAYRVRAGVPELVRLPSLDFVDDKAGKPIAIEERIGRRPIAAFGNSDGDFEMLEWTTAGARPHLGVLVHHTDAEREWAYDEGAERALGQAPARGWVVVDIRRDWRRVFP